jgi:hypothetical protein
MLTVRSAFELGRMVGRDEPLCDVDPFSDGRRLQNRGR